MDDLIRSPASHYLAQVARVYGHLLGGCTTQAVDRELADQLRAVYPAAEQVARELRTLHADIVRYVVSDGITQLVDIGGGAGLPGPTHELAHKINANARVIYVDNDLLTAQLMRAHLHREQVPNCASVTADLQNVYTTWATVQETGLIDKTQPVALLLLGVLHTIDGYDLPDDDDYGIYRIIWQYTKLLPAGSLLAVTHLTTDAGAGTLLRPAIRANHLLSHAGIHLYPRDAARLPRLLDPLTPVNWRTEGPPAAYVWAGIGRKHTGQAGGRHGDAIARSCARTRGLTASYTAVNS